MGGEEGESFRSMKGDGSIKQGRKGHQEKCAMGNPCIDGGESPITSLPIPFALFG